MYNIKTAVDTIRYNITVTSVDKDTTVSMYPATSDGDDCASSAEITGTGKYTITCDMGSADGLMNMGYFNVDNDAQITFVIDSITVNGKYEIDISTELTNTREWADGLRNIWNGFSDGDKVYYSDNAEFRYIKSDDAIEFFAAENAGGTGGNSNAPLLDRPVDFLASVKGIGRMEVRLDSPTGEILASIDFDSKDKFTTVRNSEVALIGGTHDLYFVFSDKDIAVDSWTFLSNDNTEKISGDVNADGEFNIADIMMMQKWLLAVPDVTLADWKVGDLCEDDTLNVFDLCLMKRLLIYGEIG